jgi:hypothetical protein
MNEEQKRQFFAMKVGEPKVMRMGGKKLSMANIPEDVRSKLLDRLVEKDEVLKQGQKGILPGLLIDGKQVTKDNIHEFEKKEVKKEEVKEVTNKPIEVKKEEAKKKTVVKKKK